MSFLETQYEIYLKEHPNSRLNFDEWLEYFWEPKIPTSNKGKIRDESEYGDDDDD